MNRSKPISEFKGPTGTESSDCVVRHALVSITTREGINAAIVLSAVS
jgi:hypothetical protein